MPSSTSFPNQKDHEVRLSRFQELLDVVLSYACQYQEVRRNIMSMLRRFLCDNAKSLKEEKKPEVANN
jgi:hypothetical protein